MKKIDGKTFVIIGASGDIGGGLARALHQAGANVVLVGRKSSQEKLIELRRELGPQRVLIYACDLTDPREILELLRTTKAHFGSLNALITSVGRWEQINIESSSEKFAEQLKIDLGSFVEPVSIPIFVANRFFLKNGGGLIVDISSHAAVLLLPGNLTYAQAKAAVKAFLDNLRAENGPKSKSKITQIIAQLVDTPNNRKNFPKLTEKQWQKTVQISNMMTWIVQQVRNKRVPKNKFFKSGIVV